MNIDINSIVKTNDDLLQKGIIKKDNNTYTLNKKYKIGKIYIKKNITQLIIDDIQKIFIEKDKLNGAYSNDLVLVQIIFNPRGKIQAKVIKILERNNSEILCYLNHKNEVLTVKDNIKINTESLNNIKVNDIFIVKNNQIIDIWGNIKKASFDEKISLYLYNQDYRNTQYSFNQSKKQNSNDRIDLTNLPFCTIDPASAKDHDDAIYFDEKEKILYVAIADVSAFIEENTSIDIQARKRAYSIYLPNKVLPMLPFELSNDMCSLKPNVKRLAYVFKMKIDINNLTVISSEVFEATIISTAKYSYEQIDNQIKTKTLSHSLTHLYNLTKRLRKKRLLNGFDFRTKELRLMLDENEDLKKVNIETSSASHQLVEECMLLTNTQAAKKIKGLGIFRIHEEPSLQALQRLVDEISMLGLKVKLKNDIHQTIESIQLKAKNRGIEEEVDKLIIQSQQQARYSAKKLGHFGLGFDNYSHFTSPIRRYSDLVLHRILKNNTVPKDIENICEDLSNIEREIAFLVWDLEDRKYARWAKNNIGIKCNAKIVDIENHIVKLESNIQGARVICGNYNGEKLFTNVKIKIKSSNIISKEIKGIII